MDYLLWIEQLPRNMILLFFVNAPCMCVGAIHTTIFAKQWVQLCRGTVASRKSSHASENQTYALKVLIRLQRYAALGY